MDKNCSQPIQTDEVVIAQGVGGCVTASEYAFGAPHAFTKKHDKGPEGRKLNTFLKFQQGPAEVYGHNGWSDSEIIRCLLVRMRGFQRTPTKCRETSLAITKLEEALHWLQSRIERIAASSRNDEDPIEIKTPQGVFSGYSDQMIDSNQSSNDVAGKRLGENLVVPIDLIQYKAQILLLWKGVLDYFRKERAKGSDDRTFHDLCREESLELFLELGGSNQTAVCFEFFDLITAVEGYFSAQGINLKQNFEEWIKIKEERFPAIESRFPSTVAFVSGFDAEDHHLIDR